MSRAEARLRGSDAMPADNRCVYQPTYMSPSFQPTMVNLPLPSRVNLRPGGSRDDNLQKPGHTFEEGL